MIPNRRYDLLFAQSPDELIGFATTSGDGILLSPFTIPSTARLGAARITVDPVGEGQVVVVPISIIAGAPSTSTPLRTTTIPTPLSPVGGATTGTPRLPNTGLDAGMFVAASGALILFGALLIHIRRRYSLLGSSLAGDIVFDQRGRKFYSGG